MKIKILYTIWLMLTISTVVFVSCKKEGESLPPANPEKWEAPNPLSFEYNMTYVTQISFGGILSADTTTILAAFNNDECRAKTKMIYEPGTGKYLCFLTIYSNHPSGESIKLKAYNPLNKRFYEDCGSINFQNNLRLGNASEILDCKQ